jgi:hypothetical protein
MGSRWLVFAEAPKERFWQPRICPRSGVSWGHLMMRAERPGLQVAFESN